LVTGGVPKRRNDLENAQNPSLQKTMKVRDKPHFQDLLRRMSLDNRFSYWLLCGTADQYGPNFGLNP